ncbi:DUF4926 domain-containing protein [Pectobacterium polaris]|nr:DUF4926 domain-containing protein [Pectobacterium polaris]
MIFQGRVKKEILGAIVHIYNDLSPAYEIGFCDDNGEALAWFTLTSDCFNKVDFKK